MHSNLFPGMVSSNVNSLDEVTDDSNTATTRPPPTNVTAPNPPLDDHNNPIIMNEPPPPNPIQTHSTATETATIESEPFDDDTSNTNAYTGDHNNYMPSPASAAGDESDASDATCENDDPSTIEMTKCEDDAMLPKAMLRADDILISHSTPVVMAGMATVPSRPLKSIRPTAKAAANAASKNVHFPEETKPTVRVLLLCQPSSHQFQVNNSKEKTCKIDF